MTFDAADLALIEIAPDATGLEKALVAEIRGFQKELRIRDSRISSLEDQVSELVDELDRFDWAERDK
jgi:hypothetical protein